MRKTLPKEQKLTLENLELRRANMELQANVLQSNLVKLQEEYQKSNTQYEMLVQTLNTSLGIDLKKYKLDDSGVVCDEKGVPVDFPETEGENTPK